MKQLATKDHGGIFGFGILGTKREQRGGSRYRMGEGMLYLEATFGFPNVIKILDIPADEVKNARELVEKWQNHPVLDVKIVGGHLVVNVREVNISVMGKGFTPIKGELTFTKF